MTRPFALSNLSTGTLPPAARPLVLSLLVLLLLAFCLPLTTAQAADFDALDRLLHRHVSPGQISGIPLNVVNYKAWAADDDYPRAVAALAAADPAMLKGREQTMAFWINAYNLLAIKTVLDTRVKKSIKDAGSLFTPVWKRKAGKVGGKKMTLHQIEHEILRPMGDPRVHMAIVCASLSCPDLRREAFDSDRLDFQLNEQARRFLDNTAKGLKADGNKLVISSIFDWFADDFGGEAGVIRFIRANARQPISDSARIDDYFDYNWNLNTTR